MSGSSPGDVSDEPDDPGDSGDRDARADSVHDRERGARADRDNPSSGTERAGDDRVTLEDDGVVQWFLRSEDGNAMFVRDVLSSVAIVAVIGLILFGVSGVWPPLVAVESGSMEPNMERGDLIFVVEDERFVGDGAAADTGVVTLEEGQESGHEKFGNPGDVIVFQPNGNERRTPIIHRAHFWVEEDERWVETKADEELVGDLSCEEVTTCPAPHDGFVTKGDANGNYDQIARMSGADTSVVRPEWITGKAMFRVPWLGHVRLTFDEMLGSTAGPTPSTPMLEGTTPADAPATSAALAGSTGVAAAGGAAVTVLGRRRY